ncbi:MAG: response regulator [Candidatus Eremiobacteraeota bacterium]|nr:response regulator [Candidatus Eremiobacteraeota bacterium]
MKTVLIIEDELLIQDLFVTLLEVEGYSVLAAEDGLEGVRLALEHKPDLVLSDLSLPGLNGFQVVEQLLPHGLKVVAVTAHSRAEDLQKIEDAGFSGYLAKPVHPHSFVKSLQPWLS